MVHYSKSILIVSTDSMIIQDYAIKNNVDSLLSKNKFNKHWHTHGDDLNNISKKTLKAIGQTVMHVIYND